MKNFTYSLIGLITLFIGFLGGTVIVLSCYDATVAAAEKEDGSTEEGELKLSQDSEVTLGKVRDFWKKEQIKHKRLLPEFSPFRVPPRKETQLEAFPCSDCHEDDEINIDKERKLTEEHQSIVLDHGGGRFWCLTCHNLKNMNYLRSLKDKEIDFNQSYLLCGQCHSPRQKDWFLGAHGKRVSTWTGERIILLCTECHNPHSPYIKPKQPDPPPKKHKGVLPMDKHLTQKERETKSKFDMWNFKFEIKK
ncbi:hypothetical protein WDW89_22810 [Deltaproteobacteria bacterium TL4]